jgi:probable phosphoglycerate mutase
VDLVLVRHAEPVRVGAGDTGGSPADPGLTERGHDQSARLAAWLAHERFDQLLVTSKRRSLETAAPVADALGLSPVVDDGWIEYDAQADHYIPMEELRASNDPRFAAMVDGRWEEFGGEPPAEFRVRVATTLDRVIGASAGQRVLVVCHGGVINVALALVLDLDRHLWFDPGYTSISRIVASRHGIRSVAAVNETAHLIAKREATP